MTGDRKNTATESDSQPSSDAKWWQLIFLLALSFPVIYALSLSEYLYLFYFMAAVEWILTVLSPIAGYFDRQYVAAESE
ncbi:hypothetical protein [Halopiger aswanensis]|uniref:Uncharacterized protein n=1 Tax=Halopiger aswanensis TaxID=148449 RepID=A0A3R7GT63_9EURY|nr:hypothetical protein [Halopiger aswanensis]RKD88659.1 hypothetical protein ATJ93_4323 [Halopiger aswanensis]